MSGTDYTQTTNYALYKPLPNADINQWGSHLNANADTLDGLMHGFLPLAGGTPTGPIMITATGGSVARSAQARAADVANVLDYGADPTNVADSTPAFNTAAAQTNASGKYKAVYAPGGVYRINGQINLTAGQTLYGDGRGSTVLWVDQAFSPAAFAVIICTSGLIDPGPTIRDLGITFAQPPGLPSRAGMLTLAGGGTSGSGGTGIRYPWAIAAASDSYRIQLSHLRIGGAWDGITSNGHNAVFWLDDVELGALDCGLSLGEGASGIYDFCHIQGLHFWDFDLTTTQQLAVFRDGQTIALRLANVNGLDARGVTCHVGRVVLTTAASAGWFQFTNLDCDGDQSTLEIGGALWAQITNFYSTDGGSANKAPVSVTGGNIVFTNFYAAGSSAFPRLSVSGGDVTVAGALIAPANATVPAVSVTAGALRMTEVRIPPQLASTVYAQPLIAQSGTGILQVNAVDASTTVAGSSGTVVGFAADNAANSLGSVVVANNWQVSMTTTAAGTQMGPITIWRDVSPTSSHLALYGWNGTTNGVESKLRFHGTFATGVDYGPYLAASLRAGWGSNAWNSAYLNLYTTNAANSAGSDANMTMVASFGAGGYKLPVLPGSASYASDAAAASAGIPIGGVYRNGSAVMVRVS